MRVAEEMNSRPGLFELRQPQAKDPVPRRSRGRPGSTYAITRFTLSSCSGIEKLEASMSSNGSEKVAEAGFTRYEFGGLADSKDLQVRRPSGVKAVESKLSCSTSRSIRPKFQARTPGPGQARSGRLPDPRPPGPASRRPSQVAQTTPEGDPGRATPSDRPRTGGDARSDQGSVDRREEAALIGSAGSVDALKEVGREAGRGPRCSATIVVDPHASALLTIGASGPSARSAPLSWPPSRWFESFSPRCVKAGRLQAHRPWRSFVLTRSRPGCPDRVEGCA